MSVLLYSFQANDDGKGLQRIVETLVPNEHSGTIRKILDNKRCEINHPIFVNSTREIYKIG